MTFKQLNYFLKIAETCNLTKAAQLLNVSQPPLSYQLKLLEDELGVQLFIRDARNMKITNEGIYLQKKASQILTLINQTAEDLKHFSYISPVNINIGAVSSSNHNMLPRIIQTYKQQYPNTIFNIYDGSSMRIQELLDNGIIDLGILREPFNKNLYCGKRIFINRTDTDSDDYFVAAGKKNLFGNHEGSEIPLKYLCPMPLVIHRRFEENFVHNCDALNITPNIISRNDNIVTSIEWAENGMGIAVMPLSSSLLIQNSDVVVKKIIDPVSSANLFLIWRTGEKFPISILEFINLF